MDRRWHPSLRRSVPRRPCMCVTNGVAPGGRPVALESCTGSCSAPRCRRAWSACRFGARPCTRVRGRLCNDRRSGATGCGHGRAQSADPRPAMRVLAQSVTTGLSLPQRRAGMRATACHASSVGSVLRHGAKPTASPATWAAASTVISAVRRSGRAGIGPGSPDWMELQTAGAGTRRTGDRRREQGQARRAFRLRA
jgi:hypothetical protein